MNQHWPRWIAASVHKHFVTQLPVKIPGITIFIEGQWRKMHEKQNFFEVRLDGPRIRQTGKREWLVYGEVNILCQATQIESYQNSSEVYTTDVHAIHRLTGAAASCFTDINLFKYGNDVTVDDGTFLACWRRLDDLRGENRIQINLFGQIEVATALVQATVEAHYEAIIKE